VTHPVPEDSLALLVLPGPLEGFELEQHARGLLSVPRVIALEPGRLRPPRPLRDPTALRQARRLRLPGRLALLVLYHPQQYPLVRALRVRHEQAELWYAEPAPGALDVHPDSERGDLVELDELARHHASGALARGDDGSLDDGPLRARLRELDVISPYAFVPSGRMGRARWPRPGR
jgi:hypothetical protein